MKKHLLLWFNDLGSAYVAANEAAKQGAKILEIYPFGSRGHLLLETAESFATESYVGKLKSKPTKHQEFQRLDESVLPAYLSLANPPLHDHILIIESNFLGDVFHDCLTAVEVGLAILDLRFVRDSSGHSYAILTGRLDMCETLLQQTKCKAQLVDRPHQGLKEFFPV